MEPLSLAGIKFENVDQMTGLAEYRNGGLFVDMNVLVPRIPVKGQVFQVYDDLVVEWRGLTVPLLDLVADKIRKQLNVTSSELPLAKILEAGYQNLQ
jgi:hypothetical protein